MKAMTITSEQLGKWMANFNNFDSREDYQSAIQAIRCIFDVNNNKEFYEEACKIAKQELIKIMNRK